MTIKVEKCFSNFTLATINKVDRKELFMLALEHDLFIFGFFFSKLNRYVKLACFSLIHFFIVTFHEVMLGSDRTSQEKKIKLLKIVLSYYSKAVSVELAYC